MVAHPALVEAAAGHIRYYEANPGSEGLAGMGLHEQHPEAPGFTGVENATTAPKRPATTEGPSPRTPASGGWTPPWSGTWAR